MNRYLFFVILFSFAICFSENFGLKFIGYMFLFMSFGVIIYLLGGKLKWKIWKCIRSTEKHRKQH